MPVTLVSTLAGSTSNSLISLADADVYFEPHLDYATWDAYTDDQKKSALITATRSFSELSWWGTAYTTTQALPFPRVHSNASTGTTIPSNILAAVCEHALALRVASAAGTTDERAAMRAAGVTSWTMGNRSETLSAQAATSTDAGMAQFSGRVQRLLQGWVRGAWSTDSGRRSGYGGSYDAYGQWWPWMLMP